MSIPVWALLIFAIGTIAVLMLGVGVRRRSPAREVPAVLAVAARILQSSVHLASGGNRAIAVRFTFLLAQHAAFIAMAVLIGRHAADA
jgi:hypothetical protein